MSQCFSYEHLVKLSSYYDAEYAKLLPQSAGPNNSFSVLPFPNLLGQTLEPIPWEKKTTLFYGIRSQGNGCPGGKR